LDARFSAGAQICVENKPHLNREEEIRRAD